MAKADRLWQPCILGPGGLSIVTKIAIDGWGPLVAGDQLQHDSTRVYGAMSY